MSSTSESDRKQHISRRERPTFPKAVENIMADVKQHLIKTKLGGNPANDRSNLAKLFEHQCGVIAQSFSEARNAVNDGALWKKAFLDMGALLGWSGYADQIPEAMEIQRKIANVYLDGAQYAEGNQPTEETRKYVMNDLLLSHMSPEQLQEAIDGSAPHSRSGKTGVRPVDDRPSLLTRLAETLRPTRTPGGRMA